MKKINRIQLILSITLIIISATITGAYNYNTYSGLNSHINSLSSQIKKIQEENTDNEKQISYLKDELNCAKQYEDLYDKLNTENEKLKSDYNTLKTSNETLQAQNKELTDYSALMAPPIAKKAPLNTKVNSGHT